MRGNELLDLMELVDPAYVADLFIVSQAQVTVGSELAVEVAGAEGAKCERCWKIHPMVGAHKVHSTLCPRCAGVVPAVIVE